MYLYTSSRFAAIAGGGFPDCGVWLASLRGGMLQIEYNFIATEQPGRVAVRFNASVDFS
jgi:hypothetical protein